MMSTALPTHPDEHRQPRVAAESSRALASAVHQGHLFRKKLDHGWLEDPYKERVFCWLDGGTSDSTPALYLCPNPQGTPVEQHLQGSQRLPLLRVCIETGKTRAKGEATFTLRIRQTKVKLQASKFAEAQEWVRLLHEQQEQALLQRRARGVQRMLTRLTKESLAHALHSWVSGTASAHAHAAKQRRTSEQRRQEQLMSKIVKRMLNASLSAALGRWCQNVAERQARAAKTRKVLARWRHSASTQCLDAWYAWAEDERRKRALLGRIVRRMLQRCLGKVWCTWAASVEHARVQREDEKRRQHLMSKILHRMTHGTAARALQRWMQHADEAAALQRTARKVVIRLGQAVLCAAWEHWVGLLQGLQESLEQQRQLEIQQIDMELKALRAVQRLLSRSLASAWQVWLQHTLAARRVRARLSTVMRRWTCRSAAVCVEVWRVFCAEGAHRRAVMLRIVGRIKARALVVAFDLWAQHVLALVVCICVYATHTHACMHARTRTHARTHAHTHTHTRLE